MFPFFAFAGAPTEFTGFTNPIASNDFEGVIGGIIDFLQPVAVAVLVIMVFVGAFQWLFAGPDPKKIESGRKTLTWAVIGFVALLLARVLVSTVASLLG